MLITETSLTAGVHAECGHHCLSHSRRQRTKPELGLMHGRRWRTNVIAVSNDIPRLRMRYAITIAAERETPYTRCMRINVLYIHVTRQSKSGDDYERGWTKMDGVGGM
jgi:hypothetical protein